jgi:hypothetical protein
MKEYTKWHLENFHASSYCLSNIYFECNKTEIVSIFKVIEVIKACEFIKYAEYEKIIFKYEKIIFKWLKNNFKQNVPMFIIVFNVIDKMFYVLDIYTDKSAYMNENRYIAFMNDIRGKQTWQKYFSLEQGHLNVFQEKMVTYLQEAVKMLDKLIASLKELKVQ